MIDILEHEPRNASYWKQECKKLMEELDALKSREPVADGDGYVTKLYARPAPAIPAGMALVPIEPTPDMKSRALDIDTDDYCLSWEEISLIYKAMIETAQKGNE